MARIGFCGPTYQSESVNVDAQRAVNLYPEIVESQQGRSPFALYPRPGLKLAVNLPGESSVPQLFAQNGRMFAAGLNLWEIFSNFTAVNRGALNPSMAGPGTVFMAANQNQLLVLSNGLLYIMNLTTNAVAPVNMAQFAGNISMIAFIDGFFIATQVNSQIFYTSNLLDGTTWLGVNTEQVSLITDFITGMIVSHRDLWFYGNKSSVVYQNTGAALSPFSPISAGFVEQGNAALDSPVKADNSIFWMGLDALGNLVAWRANAYTPTRVSNHAVENAWAQYTMVSDLVSYSCQFNGHIFWVIYFPTANATWVYDISTGMWHEWSFLDPILGPIAHRSCCHCFAFNQHFVGDWESGNIYQMSTAFNDDFGTPIQKLRRAPHVGTELQWTFHRYFQLDVEPGVGPVPPLAGTAAPTLVTLADANGVLWNVGVTDAGLLQATLGGTAAQTLFINDLTGATTWQVGVTIAGLLTTTAVALQAGIQNSFPMVSSSGTKLWNMQVTFAGLLQTVANGTVTRSPFVYLRWSDDAGHTWSNLYALPIGFAGQYRTRVIWRRLGRARSRVYEVSCTDPVPFRIVDAYLDAEPNYGPTERVIHQVRKGA
jgi:hypothetical protein